MGQDGWDGWPVLPACLIKAKQRSFQSRLDFLLCMDSVEVLLPPLRPRPPPRQSRVKPRCGSLCSVTLRRRPSAAASHVQCSPVPPAPRISQAWPVPVCMYKCCTCLVSLARRRCPPAEAAGTREKGEGRYPQICPLRQRHAR